VNAFIGYALGLMLPGILIVALLRRGRSHNYEGTRTSAGVMMGHVYDPTRFRTLDYVMSDEGQNKHEIVIVNNTTLHNSNLLLIEGRDGLTVLEIGSESSRHGNTASLN
jgi:hypothetical protein